MPVLSAAAEKSGGFRPLFSLQFFSDNLFKGALAKFDTPVL